MGVERLERRVQGVCNPVAHLRGCEVGTVAEACSLSLLQIQEDPEKKFAFKGVPRQVSLSVEVIGKTERFY
jgi:hypothetical protein